MCCTGATVAGSTAAIIIGIYLLSKASAAKDAQLVGDIASGRFNNTLSTVTSAGHTTHDSVHQIARMQTWGVVFLVSGLVGLFFISPECTLCDIACWAAAGVGGIACFGGTAALALDSLSTTT